MQWGLWMKNINFLIGILVAMTINFLTIADIPREV